MAQQREEYLTKTISFGSGTMTLYSLDGQTWSSRREELSVIKERQEQQRMILMGKKDEQEGEAAVGIKYGSTEDEVVETVEEEPKVKLAVDEDSDEPFVLGDDDVALESGDDEEEDEEDTPKIAVKATLKVVKKDTPKAKKAAPPAKVKAAAKPKTKAKSKPTKSKVKAKKKR